MSHYEALADAIVAQAAKDYRMALRKLKKQTSSLIVRDIVRDVEAFFRSSWFRVLTTINPNDIFYRLRREESNT